MTSLSQQCFSIQLCFLSKGVEQQNSVTSRRVEFSSPDHHSQSTPDTLSSYCGLMQLELASFQCKAYYDGSKAELLCTELHKAIDLQQRFQKVPYSHQQVCRMRRRPRDLPRRAENGQEEQTQRQKNPPFFGPPQLLFFLGFTAMRVKEESHRLPGGLHSNK